MVTKLCLFMWSIVMGVRATQLAAASIYNKVPWFTPMGRPWLFRMGRQCGQHFLASEWTQIFLASLSIWPLLFPVRKLFIVIVCDPRSMIYCLSWFSNLDVKSFPAAFSVSFFFLYLFKHFLKFMLCECPVSTSDFYFSKRFVQEKGSFRSYKSSNIIVCLFVCFVVHIID